MDYQVKLFCSAAQHLRQVGVVGKFVEFFGPGVAQLSIADRATIANMCPEYGATAAFFPVDEVSIKYLVQTGKYRTRKAEVLCKVLQNSEIWSTTFCSAPCRTLGHIYHFFFSLHSQNGRWDFSR